MSTKLIKALKVVLAAPKKPAKKPVKKVSPNKTKWSPKYKSGYALYFCTLTHNGKFVTNEADMEKAVKALSKIVEITGFEDVQAEVGVWHVEMDSDARGLAQMASSNNIGTLTFEVAGYEMEVPDADEEY